MAVKERVIDFVNSENISIREFERQCNLSNGYVKGIKHSILPDKMQGIALRFPQLNTNWLLTGEGEMLKSTERQATVAPNTVAMPAEVWEVIKSQADSLKSKDGQMDLMLENLKIKDAQTSEVIAILKEQLKKGRSAEPQAYAASVVVEEVEE